VESANAGVAAMKAGTDAAANDLASKASMRTAGARADLTHVEGDAFKEVVGAKAEAAA